jgi:hypothetical protein
MRSRVPALLEHAILLLEVVNHIQLIAVDPPSELHQQSWLATLSGWSPRASSVYLDNTGYRGLENRPHGPMWKR